MTLPRSERGPASAAEQVIRSVELDAAPEEVWDALTDEALLGEWLAEEVELAAAPGGEIRCRYAAGAERRGEHGARGRIAGTELPGKQAGRFDRHAGGALIGRGHG